ncbi:MAG: hypothetical protein BWY79_00685 [Actinobacteria bacterium ADurb.Bin444]|nr:MAG: hypothetical protein BWY79_00685 [Actinobacteria bacterium ADurb.Bin444]
MHGSRYDKPSLSAFRLCPFARQSGRRLRGICQVRGAKGVVRTLG